MAGVAAPPGSRHHPRTHRAEATSQALDRIRNLRRAGFGFLAHRDDHGEITALQAVRVRAGHIETVLIHGERDALAARGRDEAHPAVVCHQVGDTADVIAELLGPPAPEHTIERWLLELGGILSSAGATPAVEEGVAKAAAALGNVGYTVAAPETRNGPRYDLASVRRW